MAASIKPEDLKEISMKNLVEQVLPFRSEKYLEDFVEKLLAEGIANPNDLLGASKEALETKLSSHASFNFIEMADALSLRKSIDSRSGAEPVRAPRPRSRSPPRRARSRSPGGYRGGGRDFSGGRGGFRNNSRPHRRHDFRDRRPRSQDRKAKPELWSAVERNDERSVQELLMQGKDPEERYEGWTPLMKASEENAVDVLRMLIEKKCDLEAHNRKGRTALSFAAAPSNDGSNRRNTPINTLRLLLESGADTKHKDVRGMTAKDCASREKREDSLSIFEEFSL